MTGYYLVFGTENDNSGTILGSSYVSQSGTLINLNLPSDYTGGAVYYFENTNTGMGYVEAPEATSTTTTTPHTYIDPPNSSRFYSDYYTEGGGRALNVSTISNTTDICWAVSIAGLSNINATNNDNTFMTIDCGSEIDIVGLRLRPRGSYDQYVKTLIIDYSSDGSTYYNVDDGNIFDATAESGNKDFIFTTPVLARYIKIIPRSFNNHASIKVGLIQGTITTTITNTYTVTVSNEVFYIDGSANPNLTFTSGDTYIFDLSHNSNAGNTLVLGTIADSSTNLIDYQNIVGTPGQSGSYTIFTASGELVYYYSFETPDMGYVPLIPIYHITMNAADVTYGGSVVNRGSSSQGTFTCNQSNDTNITFDNNYLEIKVEGNFTGITMSNLNVPNNYTISFWFNANSNKRTFVIGYKTTSNQYNRIEWWSNRWAPGGTFTNSGGNSYYSVCGSQYNTWHFISFVVSGDNVHLYENGLDTNSSTTLTTSSTPNGDEFIIAYGPSYPIHGYNGLDDFKIYGWALSSEQITTIYDSYTLPYSP
jgi:hypothetical protein